jgi:hypothetical protein
MNRKRRVLIPLSLTDRRLDSLAGVDGFSEEDLDAAQRWGTPRLRALLNAKEEGEDDDTQSRNGDAD